MWVTASVRQSLLFYFALPLTAFSLRPVLVPLTTYMVTSLMLHEGSKGSPESLVHVEALALFHQRCNGSGISVGDGRLMVQRLEILSGKAMISSGYDTSYYRTDAVPPAVTETDITLPLSDFLSAAYAPPP